MCNFEQFVLQLKETNTTLESLVDFDKVNDNVSRVALKLHQLNYLLGKQDLHKAVSEVYAENPKAFEVLGILVAVREGNKKVLDADLTAQEISSFFTDVDRICYFIEKCGLKDIFTSQKIANLVDYVFGVEVGLDTNARKNRGGEIMAYTVAEMFRRANVVFKTEVYSTEYPAIQTLGVDLKRFDFVIEKSDKIFLIETNFYNSGGSKLNEVARAYSELSVKISQCPAFEFVWITDGQGWLSAKNKLEEAISQIPRVYNLTTLNEFINEISQE